MDTKRTLLQQSIFHMKIYRCKIHHGSAQHTHTHTLAEKCSRHFAGNEKKIDKQFHKRVNGNDEKKILSPNFMQYLDVDQRSHFQT